MKNATILWLVSTGQAAGQVLRGGAFNNHQNNAAAAYRNNNNPNNDHNNFGVRLVLAAMTFSPFREPLGLLPKVVSDYDCSFEAKAEG
ncbi:MAG: hypothetical protein K8L99_15225 [Anaerolineae bacterium]|nr:hypothetical protein [Anaerolineae bacterium]